MSLKDLRREAGLSQHELGVALTKKLGQRVDESKYYQPRIAAYESGRNSMSVAVAVALVAALNAALKKAGSKQRASIELLVSAPKKKPRR